MTTLLIIAAGLVTFIAGYAAGTWDASLRTRRLKERGEILARKVSEDREYWIHQRDEARANYYQAAALARGALGATAGADGSKH